MKLTEENLKRMLDKSKTDIDLDLGIVRLHYKKKDLDLSVIYTYSNEDLEVYYELNNDFKTVSKNLVNIIYKFCNNLYEEELKENESFIRSWTNISGMGSPIN